MNPPKLQGRSIDLGLSATGRMQAERAAAALALQKITAVYSSSMIRARETAEIVARPHGVAVHTKPQLVEVDVGRWEMRSWVDIAREEPDAYERFQADPGVHGYAGGENLSQVLERTSSALQALMGAHLGEQIVVVGHNVVNRALLADALGLPMSRARSIHQENCGINILEYTRGRAKVVTLNSVLHLHA